MASNSRHQRFQQDSSIYPALEIPKLQLPILPKSIFGTQTEHSSKSQTERSGRLNPILPNTVTSHHSAVTSRPSVNVMQNIVCFSSFDPFKSKNLPQDLVQYLDLLENKVHSFLQSFCGERINLDSLSLVTLIHHQRATCSHCKDGPKSITSPIRGPSTNLVPNGCQQC